MSDYSNYISESDAGEVYNHLKRLYEEKAGTRVFSEGNKQNVFLSHKHDEKDLVLYIKTILEGNCPIA